MDDLDAQVVESGQARTEPDTNPLPEPRHSLTGRSADPVRIELSSAQVSEISREAVKLGHLASLLTGRVGHLEELTVAYLDMASRDKGLSSSLKVGLLVLAAFPEDGALLANADVARTLGLQPSTSHRYVSTLVAVGLLERDPATRRYRLTPNYISHRHPDADRPNQA